MFEHHLLATNHTSRHCQAYGEERSKLAEFHARPCHLECLDSSLDAARLPERTLRFWHVRARTDRSEASPLQGRVIVLEGQDSATELEQAGGV